ncbi:cysteine desulfurase family protein [Bacillus sp. CGMCC 1.16607]|uniref:cysteine desulfurase family protein n=1 Tax=Bacillus sp. CGMCC 1.16607 TaxID=3351842 RepID=UPI00363E06C6
MIYFDNSATTKPYKEVVDSFVKVSNDFFANPSSLHKLGGQAEALLNQARNQIAQLLNIKQKEINFTSGGTESNNLAIKGAAMMFKKRGNHIITTAIEHASIYESMEILKNDGFSITYLPVDSEGRINLNDLKKAIRNETILVSIIHVNNEVGTIQPIKEIGDLLKDYPKILFHVDHVQGIGKVPINIHEYGIDLCSISAHKFHGLKGNGILYVREGVKIAPLLTGGNQEGRNRSGTENVAGIVAMAKALRLNLLKSEKEINRLIGLKTFILDEIQQVPEIIVHTPIENSAPHIINFSVVGFKAEVFVHALEEEEIYVSTTSACSSKINSVSHTLIGMGIDEEIAKSAVRLSLSFENTEEEARLVIRAIRKTIQKLGRTMK